ncbi:MAG: asparagine synthase C-terminal domain-containing protein [Candidatus Poseidoniales archaeon]
MKESEWIDHINYLKNTNPNVTKDKLSKAIENSILDKIPDEPFGILLSGGVDSSLIAKMCKDKKANFRCFCVGIKGSKDIEAAIEVSHFLDLELIKKEYEIDEIEELLKKVIRILPYPIIENDNYIEYMVKVSVSAVMLAAITLGEENIFLSGIGAEELFAGYERHSLSVSKGGKWRGNEIKPLEDESWDGMRRLHNLVISRDQLIAKQVMKEIRNPYIDDELIILAMNLDREEKIKDENNKIILRKIAADIGVPKRIYERKKKGAQYGSGFDKAISKLTKKHGFKLKKRYIESLLNK